MELDISFGKHRADTNWKPEYLEWEEFVDRLRKVRRTGETMAEYDKMHNIGRGKVKDGPAFVGGLVRGGRRKKENVDTRSLITLDVDHADDDFLFTVELVLGGTAYVIYSTHSHRPDKPKYRLIVPADRTMSPDEYAAVSRKLADNIDMDYFDKTTFDVHRLMYLPSCSKDADPVLEVYEGEPLGVDDVLEQYEDWHDPLQWPRHKGDKAPRETAKRMEDPRAKQGVVGAFCRCYSISEAIATFLPDVYEPVDDSLSRYTHVGSTSHGGLVIYDDDTFAYSHHESDPVSGREVNAFDLVRLHKFGQLDDRASEKTNVTKLPSYTAMLSFATQDPKVKRERLAELSEDFADTDGEEEEPEDDSWKDELECHPKTGFPLPTAGNVELILTNGVWRGVLAYDAFGNSEVIRRPLPWRNLERPGRLYEPWLGADDKRLQHWFAKVFAINSTRTIQNAFTEVVHKNTFHPIKAYVESTEWDGVPRADRLFVTYLGAADTHYTRQVTRKMLLAAVARLYRPGCKFDQMLVLVGPQGAGKSSLLAKLGREWFSDSLRTFENKEAGEHLQNGWIFEIGELSAMKRTEVEEVKAFLSKTEDRYRVAYDRQVSEFPRKCVFFGTTNTRDFLRDATGNRRFWPVEVVPERAEYSHWDHLTDDVVRKIWAEVLNWFWAGESLELDGEARMEAERQQAAHMESDPREGLIQEWLESPIEDEWEDEPSEQLRDRVCAAQIWTECLGKRRGDMKPWEAKELCDILRRIPGWKERPGRVRVAGYGKQTIFERVGQ
ncbi:virulence-associated E family protein [Paenibacillus dendritiformis]|uniref:Virulence-associated E family protein n=1 Tax=Paenibacillus dendritiformis C454 TaxID=1131935 RepID=H3SAC3_9BACL|nr:virulence-associated E family protein [Paenibacillus dendritiformis]EHQ63926.1 virulence-associated E family protein [Paenibacillus dendritiformis C454]CAH8772249.1 virulence-associated E family protein [Paenibacillus dendritiformis]